MPSQQNLINKLLMAFQMKGYPILLDTSQFLSKPDELGNCFTIKKYKIHEGNSRKGFEFYKKLDVLLFLAENYKRLTECLETGEPFILEPDLEEDCERGDFDGN